jgi:hypothetical protein
MEADPGERGGYAREHRSAALFRPPPDHMQGPVMFVVHSSLSVDDMRTIADESVDALMIDKNAPMDWGTGGIGFQDFSSMGQQGVIYVGKDKDTVVRWLAQTPDALVATRLGLSVLQGSYSGEWTARRVQRNLMAPFRHLMGYRSARKNGKRVGVAIGEAKEFSTFLTRYRLRDSGYYVVFAERNGITQELADVNFNRTQIPMREVVRRIR